MGKDNQPAPWRHSKEFSSPTSYFEEREVVINDIQEFLKVVALIHSRHTTRMLWRGQADESWGLHSSLYRALRDQKYEGKFTTGRHNELIDADVSLREFFPTEEEMVAAEKKILDQSRSKWRFDSANFMEIFARIQHRGGPTRLIDFSFNPLVALWFGVSDQVGWETDGRVFCLAGEGPNEEAGEAKVSLNADWGSYQPKWHEWNDKETRIKNAWGTGSLRRYWAPPIYDSRILAQNSVFVLDGVPISGQSYQSSFRKARGEKNDNWKMADLIGSGSIYLKFLKPDDASSTRVRNFASSYTMRIPATSKEELKHQLERWFGYDSSIIYPDLEGMRQELVGVLGI